MTTILGALGAVISFILWLPQAKTTWLNRKNIEALAGISIGTQLLVIINAAIWGLYAFYLNEFWVGAAGLINGPLAVATVVLVWRARKSSAKEKTQASMHG